MKKALSAIIMCVLMPVLAIGGYIVFNDKQYAFLIIIAAFLSVIPFFIRFEKKSTDVKRLVLIAAMIALSVAGRMIFAPIQGFKPVAAVTVITAVYFGSEAGFMTGALSAVLSNFYFGQGPWTVFQMFAWGMIGLIAGALCNLLKKSKIALCVYGIFSGVVFSLIMDIWSTLWVDGHFNLSRYLAAAGTALPFTALYAVSNVIFLLILEKPIGKIIDRLKTKYDI